MEACGCDICKQLLALKSYIVKKSQWIFGGDGWCEETSSGCFDSEAENRNIGFGGLDHVLASGEDVNVVVVDTEVYSNTGGQSSKATPAGAVAKLPPQGRQPQHATSGKKIRKKDLGMIAKSYGYVYVAQVAMGASQAQYFCQRLRTPLNKSNEVSKVIKEAFILRSLASTRSAATARSLSKLHWSFFTYHGPSLSLRLNPRNGDFTGLGSQVHWTCSYATPLQSAVRPRTPLKSKSNEVSNHGIKIGMGRTQNEEKLAVECGYWHLWHFNPAEEDEGKNGFHLDSKEPDWSKLLTAFNFGIRCSQPQHRDFIMGEVRYNSLTKTFPQEAEELFVATERNAKLRYEGYKKLSEM